MNEELKRILGNNLTIDSKEIPVAHLRYKGDSKTFVTWQITSDAPMLAGDDVCLYSAVSVDIDIYSDGNYLGIVGFIKKLMLDNDWVWDGDSPEMFEEDTELYHITCSFVKERSIYNG